MNGYLVVINGKPKGPYSLEEMKQLSITPGTFVRKQGMDDFKEAHAVEELRELLGFSYLKTAPQYFAGFDQRLLATAIDHFMILAIYTMLILLSFLFITGKDERLMAFLAPMPLIFLAKLVYGSWAEGSARQATIGKKLLSIKVTDLEGSPIGFGQALGRNFAKVLSVIPLFFGYLYSFLNRKNQCWHDIAARTLVIKDRLL
ncbi:RDD family protein [Pedobacter yulinensis]|uniref:RDD family protein n=1 Tax=Pedobacter yulinensis TaxID=2126353 RepID=A0A2T3HPW4_9SPHI|nr:RDD family protein [Pedobacter yulinensis]PST84482.1 RDD family protein [Pedobacter yulinensis]